MTPLLYTFQLTIAGERVNYCTHARNTMEARRKVLRGVRSRYLVCGAITRAVCVSAE